MGTYSVPPVSTKLPKSLNLLTESIAREANRLGVSTHDLQNLIQQHRARDTEARTDPDGEKFSKDFADETGVVLRTAQSHLARLWSDWESLERCLARNPRLRLNGREPAVVVRDQLSSYEDPQPLEQIASDLQKCFGPSLFSESEVARHLQFLLEEEICVKVDDGRYMVTENDDFSYLGPCNTVDARLGLAARCAPILAGLKTSDPIRVKLTATEAERVKELLSPECREVNPACRALTKLDRQLTRKGLHNSGVVTIFTRMDSVKSAPAPQLAINLLSRYVLDIGIQLVPWTTFLTPRLQHRLVEEFETLIKPQVKEMIEAVQLRKQSKSEDRSEHVIVLAAGTFDGTTYSD